MIIYSYKYFQTQYNCLHQIWENNIIFAISITNKFESLTIPFFFTYSTCFIASTATFSKTIMIQIFSKKNLIIKTSKQKSCENICITIILQNITIEAIKYRKYKKIYRFFFLVENIKLPRGFEVVLLHISSNLCTTYAK